MLGKEAVEWGSTRIAMRPKGASGGMSVSANILRVLRRQRRHMSRGQFGI
jgi:hypothetical protein